MFHFFNQVNNAGSIVELEEFYEAHNSHVLGYKLLQDSYKADCEQAKSSNMIKLLLFDYAINIPYPCSSLQPGIWYTMSLPNIFHFGLVNEGQDLHHNYL